MATPPMTLQEVIDADWAATEENMKQVTIMAKVDNGIGLSSEEIQVVNRLPPDGENELLTRARAVAAIDEKLQKYLTGALKPLREALKKPSQQLGAWKKSCWKTVEGKCPEIVLSDVQSTALGTMKTALGGGSGDVQPFVNAQYENFLDGKPDILGSSMVVTYLCETNADFKAHMDNGLKMVELHNPTDGASQVLNIDGDLKVKLGSACDNDATWCLDLNQAERLTIIKDKHYTFSANEDGSVTLVLLYSEQGGYSTLIMNPTGPIGVYDTFITYTDDTFINAKSKDITTTDTDEFVVFALRKQKEVVYLPIQHFASDVSYELWYQIVNADPTAVKPEPTAVKPDEQCNVVAKFTLLSEKQIKFNAEKIESLQVSTGDWDWSDVKKWPADANSTYSSVTVKNGTANEYACYVMLDEYKDITDIKNIRIIHDSLKFFKVSELNNDSINDIQFEHEFDI